MLLHRVIVRCLLFLSFLCCSGVEVQVLGNQDQDQDQDQGTRALTRTIRPEPSLNFILARLLPPRMSVNESVRAREVGLGRRPVMELERERMRERERDEGLDLDLDLEDRA